MKRVLFYFFIFLFLHFFILPPAPVQADCTENVDAYGNVTGCTLDRTDGCNGCHNNGEFCQCTGSSAPTATKAPAATATPRPQATATPYANPSATPRPTQTQTTPGQPTPTGQIGGGDCQPGFSCPNGYYCCSLNQCCAVGDPNPTNNPGGGATNTPAVGITCTDWVSILANNCTQSEWNATPRGANCFTAVTAVTLNLDSPNAYWMAFANVSTGTNCTTLSNASFGTRTRYASTKSWSLTAGSGDKKVCAAFTNQALTIIKKCGSQIQIGVVPTNTPTPTPAPVSWIKLKDTSFISANSLTSYVPPAPVAYDGDDSPVNTYFIRDIAGVVAAPDINVTGLNASAKTGTPEYKVTGYSPTYLLSPLAYLSYIKARKQHTTITDLNEITGPGIYVYEGSDPLDINAPLSGVFDNNIVLLTTGVVNINTNFNPTGSSVAIVANQINFADTVTQGTGLFIANDIMTGNVALGLKIIGNLVAQNSLTNSRTQANANKPSLFIVFDGQKYIDLLPYLSTANYDWHQSQ